MANTKKTDEESGLTVEGPFVEKTPEGSYYEAFLTVDGAKFPIAVMKSGEFEARVKEAGDSEDSSGGGSDSEG